MEQPGLIDMSGSVVVADFQGDPRRRARDRRMRVVLGGAAMFTVLISALILFVLFRGAIDFFRSIGWDFGILVDDSAAPGWFPRRERFDLLTIVLGSIVMGLVAMIVAVPLGLGTAVYLSEYAPPRVRRIVKPAVEVLAGIPSVIVGYFALKFIAPNIVDPIFSPDQPRNMLVAGMAIGVLVVPIMASICEDALRAVPMSLREASYGVGARKSTTTIRVVLPAAVSGIVAAFIIATSRAIGETMVAAMAGGRDGSGPRVLSPLDPGLTMTAAMTNAAGGTDQVKAGAPFQVLFFVGLLLFLLTMSLNMIADRVVRKYRQKY
ncbi:MAG: phosphate ABC transporter permease subunit PstC [Acidimicrobiales bacterium mtb01]|nr:MAG: phosphate ABC transporter permease subunit PstC [Acidimicrobiales bacterium mtb01]